MKKSNYISTQSWALAICLIFLVVNISSLAQSGKNHNGQAKDQFVCLPCGSECDNVTYSKPGSCEHCQMKLVEKSTITFKNISLEKICSYIAGKPGTLLLDVRTPAEFNGTAEVNFGHLKNAVNIPIQELEKRIGELSKYKNKEILVYCSHSHRSPQASYLLTQQGFTKVTNMSGGMSVWDEKVTDKKCSEKLLVK